MGEAEKLRGENKEKVQDAAKCAKWTDIFCDGGAEVSITTVRRASNDTDAIAWSLQNGSSRLAMSIYLFI